MKIKFKKIIPFFLLGLISTASIGVGTYFIVQNFTIDKRATIIPLEPFDWTDYKNAETFSQKNSFKVTFAIHNGLSSGTAWSFYLDTNSSSSHVYWYLMTNFHVVNDAVQYNGGSIDSQSLFFKHNTEITRGFELSDTNENGSYRVLTSKNWVNNYRQFNVEKVNVITDNSKTYNNHDDLNLFSNTASSENNYYNIDMSVIKLTITKSTYNQFDSAIFSKIANPYQKWLNDKNKLKSFSNNAMTYIAGNPAHPADNEKEQGQLIAQAIDTYQFDGFYSYLNVQQGQNQPLDSVERLNSLYFASSYSSSFYNQWPLIEGSSGSAVYQLPIDFDFNNMQFNWMDQLPMGIYWGGISNNKTSSFKPGFIPLKTTRYNIYENFSIFLTSSYNN